VSLGYVMLCYVRLGFTHQNVVPISRVFHACYMTCPSYPSCLWWCWR